MLRFAAWLFSRPFAMLAHDRALVSFAIDARHRWFVAGHWPLKDEAQTNKKPSGEKRSLDPRGQGYPGQIVGMGHEAAREHENGHGSEHFS